jgi:hypothetical protein
MDRMNLKQMNGVQGTDSAMRFISTHSSQPEYFHETASVVEWSEFLATQRRCIVLPVRYELNLYMLCRRKWTASII